MATSPDDVGALSELIARFSEDRDWTQFHNPKNLVLALSAELGELAEVFQWLTPEQAIAVRNPDDPLRSGAIAELADMFIYLIRLAQILDVDLVEAARAKMAVNDAKYPIGLSRGNAMKYTTFDEAGGDPSHLPRQPPAEPEGASA